jgi:dipeptidyl-peptidase-4
MSSRLNFAQLKSSFRAVRAGLLAVLIGTSWLLTVTAAAQPPAETTRLTGANFKQAHKYSNEFLRQFTYSLLVDPHWIGKSDLFWYEYRTHQGKQWYRVNPRAKSKEALFDRAKLAGLLSEQVRKPLDPLQLPLTRASVDDDGVKFKFVAEDYQFEYDLNTEKLNKLGKAPRVPGGPGNMSPEQQQRMREILGEERFREFMERQKKDDKKDGEAVEEESLSDDELRLIDEILNDPEQDADDPQKKGGFGGKGFGAKGGDYRNFSPDKKWLAFIKNHNLYVAEAGKEDEALQLTKDGNEDYTFTGGFGLGGRFLDRKDDKRDDLDKDKELLNDDDKDDLEKKDVKADKDRKVRAPVTWAKDSKSFHVMRRDARGVKELFLVNSIAEPRPALMKYKYAMPGEEHIRKTELYVFHTDKKKLTRVPAKWKDEAYSDLHWAKEPGELRFVRRDRLHRNVEFCTLNTATCECKCLFLEGFENSSIVTQPIKYLDETNEMIWWSERTGWGHFYLYDRGGKFKNAITTGAFRASSIVAIDAKNRMLYFKGNLREPGENAYFNHLYSVHLDGNGLTLLDPGNADHDSKLSPSRQYVVDNCSRVDMAPVSVLRDARGNKIMDLEKADLSKLHEVGWRMPETFTVKAADGVTDLYGNLYKPFDFDPKKKYPVIAHVYPGPQTESMPHSFKSSTPQQQLAQLGFLVVQVGNRGGTPLRSKAYQAYSYWNLRDYGLADKKSAIEQLAARHAWVDIDRVGIYGHSGGGFMSAAAMLVKPYNDFFKAAVASAGNHDNNIYNNSWAERYHGMKEIPITKDDSKSATPAKKGPSVRKPPAAEQIAEEIDEVAQKAKDAKKDAEAGRKEEKKTKDQKAEKTAKAKDDDKSKQEAKKAADSKATVGKDDKKDDKSPPATRFDIKVPTNAELAANLKGRLLLVHGDMDNNVHPGNTLRLADALIKANKRFDLLILPGKAHGFANYQPYFTQRMWEFFADHLLDDRPSGADMLERRERR